MADVTKITGVGTPPDPFTAKNQKVDAEKFRAHIDRTDEEQKKKKKKPQKDADDLEIEAEEIRAARNAAKESTPSQLLIPKGPMVKEVEKSDEQQKKQQKRSEESSETVKALEAAEVSAQKVRDASQIELKEKAAEEETTSIQEQVVLEGVVPPPPEVEVVIEEEIESLSIKQTEVKKNKEHEKASIASTGLPETGHGPSFFSAESSSMSGYSLMKPETFQIFERMVMSITVMMDKGIQETIIHLNSKEFNLFGGGQLIIREYSTAPKAFNVEFQGNAQNSALFAKSVDELMKAHQKGKYNYRINRIDSSLLPEDEPLFHRKEEVGDQGPQD